MNLLRQCTTKRKGFNKTKNNHNDEEHNYIGKEQTNPAVLTNDSGRRHRSLGLWEGRRSQLHKGEQRGLREVLGTNGEG